MKKFYFTFGCGIDDLHRNCYHVIEAENEKSARDEMFRRFGDKWFTNYDSAEAAGVERFHLKEIK